MRYVVMDNLTQDILGSFSSLEEAIESAEYKSAAHPTVIEQKDGDAAGEYSNEELIRRVRAWQDAAKFYWAQAFLAKEEKAWERMRACAKQAKDAERFASPEGRLLAAVFGGTIHEAPELAVKRGATLPDEAVKQARKAVLDEIAKHEAPAAQAKRDQSLPSKKQFKTEKVARSECHDLLATIKEGDAFEIEMFYMWGATPFAEHPQFTGAWFKLSTKPQSDDRLTVRITRIYPESGWKRAGKKEAAFFVGEVEVEEARTVR